MLKKLPAPIKTVTMAGAKFYVYLVKDFFQNKYNEECLKILKTARASYLRYGNVPILDQYDSKSLIFLVKTVYKTRYENKEIPTEEWLSLRFTPGYGSPEFTEDFSHVLVKNNSIKSTFKKILFPEVKNFSKHIISISRLCKIPPKFISKKITTPLYLKKNKYTLHSFYLLNKVFIERKITGNDFSYITLLMRDEVLNKSLSTKKINNLKILLRDSHKVLGLKNPADIRIKRYMFTYKFPGYFLNTNDVTKLLKKLLHNGDITTKTLKHYSDNEYKNIRSLKFAHMGKIFSEKGKLKFSNISANKLRTISNKEIKDGPKLKIAPLKNWIKTIESAIALF